MSIYRVAMSGLAVLILSSCTLNLRGAVRNESGRDVVLLIDNRPHKLKAGALSDVFAVPRWANQPRPQHDWRLAIRDEICLYQYQTPGLETHSGMFPREPAIFVLDKAMVLNAELPRTWTAVGLHITGLPATPEALCVAHSDG